MAKLNKKQVASIKDELANGFKSQIDMSRSWGVTPKTIASINVGKTHKVEGFDYPIRKAQRNERQLELPLITVKRSRIINVQNELMFNIEKTMKDISIEYAMSYSSITRINSGKRSVDPDLVYPLRMTGEMRGRRVRTAVAEGMGVVEIQNKFGVSYEQIKGYLRGVKDE